jgi:hypothetical protein
MIYTGKPYNAMTILSDGSGQIAGWQAESVFAQELMARKISFTYTGCKPLPYDFVVHGTKDVTLDIKAKKRNVQPSVQQEGHVCLDQKSYPVQGYVFASVTNNDVSLMGWMWKTHFWDKAQIVKKGENTGLFIERADAGKVMYAKMAPMEALWEGLQNV